MDELKGMLIKLLLDYYEHGKNLDTIAIDADIKPILAYRDKIVSRVELPVKPACENCIHLKVEGGKLYAKTELCQNGKIRLWNLTNCDIDTTEFGCTYFESKSV